MAVEFPIRTSIKRPAVLNGQKNGRLKEDILVTTPGLKGGGDVILVEPAARAWRALCAAASDGGPILKITKGTGTFSYRPFEDQRRIFLARHVQASSGIAFEGKFWKLKPGEKTAAVPGTSNHGEGLAVDTGVELDGDPAAESIDDDTVQWLVDNGPAFGWHHRVRSEPWHIVYCEGDDIPDAVQEFEKRTKEEVDLTPSIVVDHNGQVWVFRVNPRTKECEASFEGGGFFSLGGSFSSGVDAVRDDDMVRIVGQGSDGKTIFSRIIFPVSRGAPDTEWFPVTSRRRR